MIIRPPGWDVLQFPYPCTNSNFIKYFSS